MTPLPWYSVLAYYFYRLLAWSPVVMRRGTRYDLHDEIDNYRFCIHSALDALEHNGEDGILEARSFLYGALTY